jgi:hypothetical protein
VEKHIGKQQYAHPPLLVLAHVLLVLLLLLVMGCYCCA